MDDGKEIETEHRPELHGFIGVGGEPDDQGNEAEDIALAELKIELLFPADEATRRRLLDAEA